MRGLLLKRKNGGGIIITHDGLFCRGAVDEQKALGDEVTVEPPPRRRLLWWLTAAALGLFCLGIGIYRIFLPGVWAYVTLDIGPSIELALDSQLRVTGQRGLNEAGNRLLSPLDLRGRPIDICVGYLLEQAYAAGYLCEGESSVVLVTVAPRHDREKIGTEALAGYVAESFPVRQGGVEIVAISTDLETRRRALGSGLSMGRYLLQQALKRCGHTVSADSVREAPLRQIEEGHGMTVAALVGNNGSVLIRAWDTPGIGPADRAQALLAAPVPE
ncbi:MAG TPA: hypothetical protein EYP63_07370 [Desulfotomaculum sp.]|nr:hypothetical protein [Desulfotomaculum sp.]